MTKLTKEKQKEIFDYVLSRTPLHVFNHAIRGFQTSRIYYHLRNELIAKYPEFEGSQLWFSIHLTEIFKPYTVDEIQCEELLRKIDKMNREYKNYLKGSAKRLELINEHNALVVLYNKMLEPQMKLRKIYRKALKNQVVQA